MADARIRNHQQSNRNSEKTSFCYHSISSFPWKGSTGTVQKFQPGSSKVQQQTFTYFLVKDFWALTTSFEAPKSMFIRAPALGSSINATKSSNINYDCISDIGSKNSTTIKESSKQNLEVLPAIFCWNWPQPLPIRCSSSSIVANVGLLWALPIRNLLTCDYFGNNYNSIACGPLLKITIKYKKLSSGD